MVSLRLNITFVPLLIFLPLVIQSSAHTVHGAMSKVQRAADETGQPRRSPINVEKEIYDGVPAAVAEVEETRIGGRKMMPKRIMGMVKEVVLLSTNGERRLIRTTSSRRGHVKVEIAGYIPFNADYHVPKPHPPKNN